MTSSLSRSAELSRAAIGHAVLEMYLAYPYPQWSREERHRRFAAELCRYEALGLAPYMRGARFLDVGCGTGNRSMMAARHYGVSEFVGLDRSSASLEIAKRVAEEESFDRFTPVEGSLFEIPYEDESFDIVVSWGVLHHTEEPYKGFREMLRVCRPGGFVGVYLYNRWNHWRHNLQKDKVSRLAGDRIEERFRVAHNLYGRKPAAEMSAAEVAVFFDKYCHPHKSDHSLGETLGWFQAHGLEPWGSFPPLGFRDYLAYLQQRSRLLDDYPFQDASALKHFVLRLASRLPNVHYTQPPRRMSRFHRLVWQLVYAWQGRHGEYSGGAALAARKPARAESQ